MSSPLPRRWNFGRRLLDIAALFFVMLVLYEFLIAPRLLTPQGVERAPLFAVATLDGPRYRLPERPGQVVFLDFWASWCVLCKVSLPFVEHFAAAHPEVQVLAVNVGEDAAVASRYAREHGLRNVVLDPDARVMALYKIPGFPTLVAIDPEGYIRGRWAGPNPAIEAAMGHALATIGKQRAWAPPLLAPPLVAPAAAATP